MAAAVDPQKKALRTSIKAKLKVVTEADLAACSERACARLTAMDVVQRSASISVYLAMPCGECRTDSLLRSLFEAGQSVYIPRVTGSGRTDMQMLRVESLAQLESFPRSRWGIPEPTAVQAAAMDDGTASGAIDLVVVPGVAFDHTCKRLGHGRGYYDTFLEQLGVARHALGLPAPITIGLGLQEQLVDAVPTADHDFVLSHVCLPDVLFSSEPCVTQPPRAPS